MYPDKITSVPHSFYTNSEKKYPKQQKQNKNKTHFFPFGSMFSVTEIFKFQQ